MSNTHYILIGIDSGLPDQPFIINAASYADFNEAQRVAVSRGEEYIDEEVTSEAEAGVDPSEYTIEEGEHDVIVYIVPEGGIKRKVFEISIHSFAPAQ